MELPFEDAVKQALMVWQQVFIRMLIEPCELISTGIILVALDAKLAQQRLLPQGGQTQHPKISTMLQAGMLWDTATTYSVE